MMKKRNVRLAAKRIEKLPTQMSFRIPRDGEVVDLFSGYGRHDYLKEFYEYDNGEFIEWLEQKGFYVTSISELEQR